MFGLTVADITIMGVYFSIVATIGAVSARLVRTREDFLMGGRKLGKFTTIMLTMGIGTHADNAVGVSAQSYKLGLAGIWYQWANLFSLPLYWIFVPFMRRARVQTSAEFFERRFGREMMLTYAVFSLFVALTSTGVMLFGSARLVESLTGKAIGWQYAILLIGVLSYLYGIAGGLIATAWNEVLQGFLTILMSLLFLPFFWTHIGGFAGLHRSIADPAATFRLVLPHDITIFWIAMMAINQWVSIFVQPQAMSNIGAAKSEIDSRVGFVGGVFTKRFLAVPWALAGIMALALFGPGTIEPDHAFGKVCRELLPSGFAGLMLACVIASVMDNCAITMVSFAGIYTNSIHGRLFPRSSERKLLQAGRLAALVFAVGTLAISYAFTDVPTAMRFMWGMIPLMGIPFLMGIVWKRMNRWGALASFIAATLASIVGQFVFDWKGDNGLPKLILFFLSSGVCFGIIVSLLTKREPAWLIKSFFLLVRAPIGQEEALRQAGFREMAGSGSLIAPAGEEALPAIEKAYDAIDPQALRQARREGFWGFLAVTAAILIMFTSVYFMARWLASI
jgi:Na+/proline symporter